MEKYIIDRLDHQGRGITYVDGKITFVDNALPDEEVIIDIIESKKKYNIAKVIEYKKESKIRIQPTCKYYSICGGCNLMHLSYEEQLKYKYDKVLNIFKRFSSIDLSKINKIVPSDKEFYYRDKISLKVDDKIGLSENKSNKIVHIDKCLLADEKINSIIDYINSYGEISGINEIVIKYYKEEPMVVIYLSKKDVNYTKILDYLSLKVKNILFVFENRIVYNTGESKIIARSGDLSYKVGPESFFQINLGQTEKIYNVIRDEISKNPSSTVLDLYCGVGSISLFIADKCKKVIGVEIVKEAIENAKQNALINNINNAEFYCGDTKDILNKYKFKPGIIIVDPPRAGLDKKVVIDIKEINPEKIIYVSCDPITLARDIDLLSDSYNILDITPYDMFPNTYHVESVVFLKRK